MCKVSANKMLTFSFFICASLACEKKVSIWLGLVLLQLFLDNIKMQYLLYFILSPLNICPQGNNMPIAIQSVITWTYFHLMLSFQKAVFLTLSDSLQMVPIIVFSLTKRFKKCSNAAIICSSKNKCLFLSLHYHTWCANKRMSDCLS